VKKIGRLFIYFIGTFIMMVAMTSQLVRANASLSLEVDQSEVAIGQTLTLSVVVSTESDAQVDEPRIPDLEGFKLQNVWSQFSTSSRMEIINGKSQFTTKKQTVFNYLLEAQKSGLFSIGPFVVNVGGKKLQSESIQLRVLNSGTQRSQPQKGRPRPQPFSLDEEEAIDPFSAQDDMFEQLLKQREQLLKQFNRQFGGGMSPPSNSQGGGPSQRQMDINTKEAFFIYAEVDKSEVYVGEQVTVSWYVYTRGQMETLDRLKFPTLKGFWKEIIEEVPALRFEDEIVNGVAYKKALLASHALFPIKPGNVVVDEFKVRSKVRILENFGLGPAYTYTKSSKAFTIKVKDLPVDGKPKDFSGAVGDFSVRSFVDNPQVQQNQPFSLKIRFEGEGNAKLIELPTLNLPAELEIYDTKTDSKFFKNGTSYKEFDVVLIPRKMGSLTIPQLDFSFFNPKTANYQIIKTEPFEISVGEALVTTNSSAEISAAGEKKSAVQKEVKLSAPVIEMSQIQLFGHIRDRVYIYLSILVLILILVGLNVYLSF
jgi:hypothetical protein